MDRHLIPHEELHDYILKIPSNCINIHGETHDTNYGKYLNHSSKNPDLYLKIFEVNAKLSVIFFMPNHNI